jgi:hypothetical protein
LKSMLSRSHSSLISTFTRLWLLSSIWPSSATWSTQTRPSPLRSGHRGSSPGSTTPVINS